MSLEAVKHAFVELERRPEAQQIAIRPLLFTMMNHPSLVGDVPADVDLVGHLFLAWQGLKIALRKGPPGFTREVDTTFLRGQAADLKLANELAAEVHVERRLSDDLKRGVRAGLLGCLEYMHGRPAKEKQETVDLELLAKLVTLGFYSDVKYFEHLARGGDAQLLVDERSQSPVSVPQPATVNVRTGKPRARERLEPYEPDPDARYRRLYLHRNVAVRYRSDPTEIRRGFVIDANRFHLSLEAENGGAVLVNFAAVEEVVEEMPDGMPQPLPTPPPRNPPGSG